MDVLDLRVRRGLRKGFKSRGEEQISRMLERNGLDYKYEYPVAVLDEGRVRLWYPDFYLPGCGIIIEYFGVNGNQDYDKGVRHKMKVYRENGIEGVFLNESCFKGDWPGKIMNQIEGILKGRVDRFYNREKYRGG